MLARNLRSVKLITIPRQKFSGRDFEWMDSPFVHKPEVPFYLHMYMQIGVQQLNPPKLEMQSHPVQLPQSSDFTSHQIAQDQAELDKLAAIEQQCEAQNGERTSPPAKAGTRRKSRNFGSRLNKK